MYKKYCVGVVFEFYFKKVCIKKEVLYNTGRVIWYII